jgi:hypothetical protein
MHLAPQLYKAISGQLGSLPHVGREVLREQWLPGRGLLREASLGE